MKRLKETNEHLKNLLGKVTAEHEWSLLQQQQDLLQAVQNQDILVSNN